MGRGFQSDFPPSPTSIFGSQQLWHSSTIYCRVVVGHRAQGTARVKRVISGITWVTIYAVKTLFLCGEGLLTGPAFAYSVTNAFKRNSTTTLWRLLSLSQCLCLNVEGSLCLAARVFSDTIPRRHKMKRGRRNGTGSLLKPAGTMRRRGQPYAMAATANSAILLMRPLE